ncbi:NMCC_0638 family (lipo)protein [Dyella subtropica]|uniref:NMCC_0638 family (lipo)protein n=1 Tax=Dyella subtropica TaxID=2992127 RepID=UPI0022519405|nr:hypothetical protein [Dyella subtropica]
MRLRSLLSGIALLLASTAGQAQDATDASAFFVKLYATTCMKHYAKPEALKAEFEAAKTPALADATAKNFLGGMPGTAWARSGPGDGKFVVSLRDDGVCAVFAQQADAINVEQQFTALVSSSPAPLKASPEQDERGMAPTGPIHTLSYAWARPGDTSKLLFTLTTAVSPDAPVQAMATLARVAK